MISAVSNQGNLHFILGRDGFNQQRLTKFPERLIMDIHRKVYIILDHLEVHHGAPVADWLEHHKDRIRLFFFPSCSPKYNPDEYMNDLKQAAVS